MVEPHSTRALAIWYRLEPPPYSPPTPFGHAFQFQSSIVLPGMRHGIHIGLIGSPDFSFVQEPLLYLFTSYITYVLRDYIVCGVRGK
jgi:hypothetical protein